MDNEIEMKDDCKKYSLLIYDLIDNKITGDEKYRLESHLKECVDCNRQFQKMVQADIALKQIYSSDNLSLDKDKVWAEIDVKMDWEAPFWVKMLNSLCKPMIWAPALCTAAVAVFIFLYLPVQFGKSNKTISSVVEVSSSRGSTMVLKTAKSGTPLIMFFPGTEKEAG